jgi:hypothetical protein
MADGADRVIAENSEESEAAKGINIGEMPQLKLLALIH